MNNDLELAKGHRGYSVRRDGVVLARFTKKADARAYLEQVASLASWWSAGALAREPATMTTTIMSAS